MSRPSVLSRSQLVTRYKDQENLAKESLRMLRVENSTGQSIVRMSSLISQTWVSAAQAMRNRTDIRIYYPNGDEGHDQAVNWIYNNIVTPADEIRRRHNIYVEQPMPPDPSQGTCSTSHRHPREVPEIDHIMCNEDAPAPVRASFLDPTHPERAYFICNSNCALIKFTPGSTDDSVVRGPLLVTQEWTCLQDAGFYQIDAAVPHPTVFRFVYFFSGRNYVLVDIANDKIERGPYVINREWPSLRSIGYDTVDAIVPLSSDRNRAYFFNGKFYAFIEINSGTNDDKVINGSKLIETEWASLRESGFFTVDSCVLVPGEVNQAYFFHGDDYVRVAMSPYTTDDAIIISRRNVGENWPSLREVFFY